MREREREKKKLEVSKGGTVCKTSLTWHASCPFSPPAQKEDAGSMNIFSVTALIFLTHSLSDTTGISASRTRSGIGPSVERKGYVFICTEKRNVGDEQRKMTEYETQWSCRKNIFGSHLSIY